MIVFTTSTGTAKYALVDTDGHVQTDVLTMPTVTVTATDLDIRNLSQTQDNVKVGDGTNFIELDNYGALKVRMQGANIDVPVNQQNYSFNQTNYGLNVQAGIYACSDNPDGDGNFRPLHSTISGSTYSLDVHLTDATIAATQSGTWNIGTVTTLTSITNAVAVTGTFWQATQPVSGTVTVTATNLDVRDLTSASDSVAAVQSGTWTVGVTDATPTTLANGQVAIDTTADLILAGSSSTRSVLIKNIGTDDVYIGTSSVSDSNGYKLAANAAIALDTEAAVYGICGAGDSSTVCYVALT